MSLTSGKPIVKGIKHVKDMQARARATAPQPNAGANLEENKKKKRTAAEIIYPTGKGKES